MTDPSARKAVDTLLAGAESPEQARAMLQALENTPQELRGSMATVLSEMKPGQATELLKQTVNGKPITEALGATLKTLPKESQEALGRVLKAVNPGDAASMLKFTQHLDGDMLKGALTNMDLALESLPAGAAKNLGKIFSSVDGMMSKMGVPITAKTAGKVLKGVGKMVPALGTAASAYATAESGMIAADSSLPPEIRFLGGMGVGLNGVDTALGVAELFGVGNVGLPANLALGAAELGLDLYTGHQIDQFRADPENWKASETLNAVVAGGAVLGGPTGMLALATTFGMEGAEDKLMDLGKVTGKAGISLAEKTGVFAADAVGGGMKMTAGGIDMLAEVIRDPGKLGDFAQAMGQGLDQFRQSAIGALGSAAQMAGQLGEQALEKLQQTGSWLVGQGKEGLETLKWMASPENWDTMGQIARDGIGDVIAKGGELGKAALKGLKDMGERGLEIGRHAIEGLKNAGAQGLEMLQNAYSEFRDNPVEAFQKLGSQAVDGITSIAKKGGELGRQAVNSLVDFVKAQPEKAKEALAAVQDLVRQGGDAAKNVLNRLGTNLSEGGKAIVDSLRNLGDAGQEALQNIADAGGELASYAGDALHDMGVRTVKHVKKVRDSYRSGRIVPPWHPDAVWWFGSNPFAG